MAKQPYRVLQIVSVMNRGGAETMLMNYYRAIDRTYVQFDFLVHRNTRGAYDDEIESLGGRIFRAPAIRPWTYLQYFIWLNNFFRAHAHEFQAVHGHIQENSGFAAHFAKKYGIRYRLASSHIADLGIDYKYPFRLLGKAFERGDVLTHRLACGVEAGKYLYGNMPFTVMKNAIDTEQYIFNPLVRENIRNELGLQDDVFAIGNVARFSPQKNHEFILKCFYKCYKSNPNVRLILVGDGILRNNVHELAKKMGIADKVQFLGLRSDVERLLQAFDVFFMPSHYEGLPVSVIEAQAAGLPCVLSDAIDGQCDVTGNVQFLPLNGPIEKWVDTIICCASKDRQDCSKKIIDAGYDVNNNIKTLLSLYGIK